MKDLYTFGERLKELRLEEGLSQEELGKWVSVSNASIGHWENGNRVPNMEAVIALAQYFRVTIEYLVGLED